MPKIPELHPAVHGWLFDGPLAEHVPAYMARLSEGRYATHTVARSLAAVAHFAHWMALSRLPVERLDESRFEQFLHEHLPHCGCAGPAMRHPREAHAALMPLLALLRQRGVISDLPTPSGPIAEELGRYNTHMRDARGLDASTRVNRLRIVQRLLLASSPADRCGSSDCRPKTSAGSSPSNSSCATPRATPSPSMVRCAATALARQLRRRGAPPAERHHVTTQLEPGGAAASAHAGQVERVRARSQAHCARPSAATPSPAALDLGLRTGEINQLRLDDIDWQHGTVTLKRTKSGAKTYCRCRMPPARRWRTTSATNARPPGTAPCSSGISRLTTVPLAWTVSASCCAGHCAAPALPTQAPMPYATRWRVVWWAAAVRSRRWPTCCGTDR